MPLRDKSAYMAKHQREPQQEIRDRVQARAAVASVGKACRDRCHADSLQRVVRESCASARRLHHGFRLRHGRMATRPNVRASLRGRRD